MLDASPEIRLIARNSQIADAEITYDLAINGYEVEVTLGVIYETETYIREPYSHGGSRGIGMDVSCTIAWVQLGEAQITRAACAAIVGADYLSEVEAYIAGEYVEAA